MSIEALPSQFARFSRNCWIAGAVVTALFVGVYGLALQREEFFHAYLIGFFFVLAPTLGSMTFCCIVHMTTGRWGFVLRRIFEAAMQNIIWVAILFIPIPVFMMEELYGEWMSIVDIHDDHTSHAIISTKTQYLNFPFWLIRAACYFAIWISISYALVRWSRNQDNTGNLEWRRKLKFIAGPAVLIYMMTMTFAAVDWAMSIEPIWFSSIYGVLYIIGQGQWTLAFAIIMVCWLARFQPMRSQLDTKTLHNIGNLQFAFCILWAYVNVSQFIIIWSANLPEENTWYLNRSTGFFQSLSVFLILFNWLIPFIIMLNRHTKRIPKTIILIAGWLIFMRVIDLTWQIVPSVHPVDTHNALVEEGLKVGEPIVAKTGFIGIFMAVIGFGLLWLGFFFHNFRKLPILPIKDPIYSPHWDQANVEEVGA